MVWGLNIPVYNDSSAFNIHSTPQHYHQQLQENTTPQSNGTSYINGAPSTPSNNHAGLANNSTTPAPTAPVTPARVGVFGSFVYEK
jgi:CCR4-NOT transcription complex subunit 7/8